MSVVTAAAITGEIAVLLNDHMLHLIVRAYASQGMDGVITVMRSLTTILTDEMESTI